MTKKDKDIKDYAYNLLKNKNYFIKDFYNKLIKKYESADVSKIIKDFVKLELLNDKYLAQMKICFLIHIKQVGKLYIINYFEKKNISLNLINYILLKYSENVYLENIKTINNYLVSKKKESSYIYNYLLRKGYEEEQIKKICN